jgi:hypothetical protein
MDRDDGHGVVALVEHPLSGLELIGDLDHAIDEVRHHALPSVLGVGETGELLDGGMDVSYRIVTDTDPMRDL